MRLVAWMRIVPAVRRWRRTLMWSQIWCRSRETTPMRRSRRNSWWLRPRLLVIEGRIGISGDWWMRWREHGGPRSLISVARQFGLRGRCWLSTSASALTITNASRASRCCGQWLLSVILERPKELVSGVHFPVQSGPSTPAWAQPMPCHPDTRSAPRARTCPHRYCGKARQYGWRPALIVER